MDEPPKAQHAPGAVPPASRELNGLQVAELIGMVVHDKAGRARAG